MARSRYYCTIEVEVVRVFITYMKVAFKDIQLPAQSQNSPTKLVVWRFCSQYKGQLILKCPFGVFKLTKILAK